MYVNYRVKKKLMEIPMYTELSLIGSSLTQQDCTITFKKCILTSVTELRKTNCVKSQHIVANECFFLWKKEYIYSLMRRQELSKKYASRNSTKTHCKNHSKIVQKGVGDCKRGISHRYATICTEHEKQNLQQNPRFRVATLNAKKYSEVLVSMKIRSVRAQYT